MTELPASGFGLPFSGRLTPSGALAQTALYMIDAAGRLWKATLTATSPPVWAFAAAPSVAEVRGFFATVATLRTTVPTVAALRTWGYL